MKNRTLLFAAALVGVIIIFPWQSVAAAGTTGAVSSAFPWAWIVSRAAGIASLILLGLLSVTGILLTTGLLFRVMSPATAWSFHRAIGTVLLVSMILHSSSLLFDRFIGLKIFDIAIPWVSHYRPTLMALGIIGFYLLLLVLATSLYTLSTHAKFWRSVHFFAFPAFILIFFHSILLGSDSHQWWMIAIYWFTGIIVGWAVIYRMMWKYRQVK